MWKILLLTFSCLLGHFGEAQNVRFLLVTESAQQELNAKFSDGLKEVQDANSGSSFDFNTVNFTRKFADDAYTDLCNQLGTGTFTAIIDMAWGGWIKVIMHPRDLLSPR